MRDIDKGFCMGANSRIKTTHCGSLPRPPELSDLLLQEEAGSSVSRRKLIEQSTPAVQAAVEKQIAAGIDIISDGEQPRVGFSMYVPLRIKGFAGESLRPIPQDLEDFPLYAERLRQKRGKRNRMATPPKTVAELEYVGYQAATDECQMLKAALEKTSHLPESAFMTAASPGIIATTMDNEFYGSYEEYVFALARELRKEYELINSYGFMLQLDAPDFGMERARRFKASSEKQFLAAMEIHLAAINYAVEKIPREKIRLHVCWGNWEGPHTHDFPLSRLLPLLYQINVGALSIEFANPRHQHEFQALRDNPLPPDFALIPGVIDTTTNFVEHPEVVANRIAEAISVVKDKERVIAGTDCGFGTSAGSSVVSPDVVWAKLAACRAGAEIASSRL
jgi:5-methyltetrahydropteroyltriglutamate--homocysteine methyltransferase